MTREEAIQALNEIFDDSEFSRYESWYGTAMEMAIEALKVQIVRCKDCRHWKIDSNCDGYRSEEDFCSWGER